MRIYILIILWISLTPLETLGQKSVPSRYISFVDLSDRANLFFYKYGISISEIVFDEVEKGQITLYYFNSFNENPKTVSFEEFRKGLIIPIETLYQSWNSEEEYYGYSKVYYKGQGYQCIKDNMNTPPDINKENWQVIPNDPVYWPYRNLSVLGLDYLVDPGQTEKMQYVHFFSSDMFNNTKYVGSLEARKVVELLNASGYLWHSKPGFMNHLVGDVFILINDGYDQKISTDLKQKIDTSKTKVSDESYNILTSMSKGRIEQFFLVENELLDTIPSFDLSRYTGGSKTDFKLLGDALLDSKNIKSWARQADVKQLKTGPQAASVSNKKISNITFKVSEEFSVHVEFYKKIYKKQFFIELDKLLNIAYQGVSDSKLKVYKTDSLSTYFTLKEIIECWTKQQSQTYPEWNTEGTYYQGDYVMLNESEYISIIDNNTNLPPDKNPNAWRGRKITVKIYQPEDITKFGISYQLVFDRLGTILSKQPISLALYAFDDAGMAFKTLGYLDYQQLLDYASSQNPKMEPFLKKWIESQTGLFMVLGNGPLKSLGNDQY